MSRKRSPHLGGTLDDFLLEEGSFDDLQTETIKEVVVWQLTKAMKVRKLSKARMAILLKTSRTQVSRLLDPTHDITLATLARVAALVGRKVRLELV